MTVQSVVQELWRKVGGKDLKATQTYPGQLGLHVWNPAWFWMT